MITTTKTLQIVMIAAILIALAAFGYYFQMPKSSIKCVAGKGQCRVCECNLGFPYAPENNEQPEIKCLFGYLQNCEDFDIGK